VLRLAKSGLGQARRAAPFCRAIRTNWYDNELLDCRRGGRRNPAGASLIAALEIRIRRGVAIKLMLARTLVDAARRPPDPATQGQSAELIVTELLGKHGHRCGAAGA
jgi:hypothetical protein